MSSASNIYSAQPAVPVLADTLLGESESTGTGDPQDREPNSDWSLKEDWLRGIQSSKKAVFRNGVVLGFSRLRMRSMESNDYITQLPRHLLIKQLRSITPSPQTSAFIIHPGSFEAFAPRTLLDDLESCSHDQPGLSREDSIKRLDSVQLFPVDSFVDAAQAIRQVSDVLQETKEKQEKSTEPHSSPKNPIILIVAGLDYLTEGVIRASNPARGTALLTATLHTLTRLSRVHASYLSIMLVNTDGLGNLSSQTHHGNARQPLEEGIHSIFHSDIPFLFPTLLMKTLDQGIDTHLLVSNVKGSNVKDTQVVEVIKDRTGAGLGKWGIWEQQ